MATPFVEVSGAQVFAVADGISPDVYVTQARVFAVYNIPAEFEQVSQVRVLAPIEQVTDIEVSQSRVFVVAQGRVENRRLRAWAFSLDGHDYYVLRLGEDATLVCDLTTGQWSDWNGHDLPYWRAHLGQNWTSIGGTLLADGYSTDVVAGDDTFGLLWVLEPEQGVDESPRDDKPDLTFGRIVTGGIPLRLRDTARCNFVYLTGSLGRPALDGAQVTLRTSDDMGRSWADQGAITIIPDDWTQQIVWSSLGLMQAPGRMFEISDDGAFARIDGLDMQ